MTEKKLTIFQRMNRVFTSDGVKVPQEKTNRYSLSTKELLRTTSKEELKTAKLEAQQNRYLSQMWQRVDNEMYQQSIHYETTRIGSYSDFESMEFFPEIAAALDIFAEEATTPGENGSILNIYSPSKRVKQTLEDLFNNRLDIHTSLPAWARNLAKYGDNFVFLNIDNKAGIIGARQMPNIEMERHENDLYNDITRGMSKPENTEYDNHLKFIWKGRDIEFQSWQIAHFRLFGDDRKLPYGTSLIEKARRIWKQLLLAEDAMLVYRVTRAPERRVFKVFVGNIDEADVPAYVDEIANKFKRAPIIDPQTGQIDLRYNQLGIDQDIFIPVRDENAGTPIDTLPGANNLDAISDIVYLQNKLFAALRIPKPFLGFDSTVGEGKNLALQDIRFSRVINRLQQSLLMELNKIAIIHLYLLGLEDDLDNFTLTLNNPSTQAEMLKVEHIQSKINLYQSAVGDAGNGFAAMSMTRAKREILGMSDEEIKQDLLEQRLEKAAAAELAKTEQVIKQTGIFNKVDNIYADPELLAKSREATPESSEKGNEESGLGGGAFGGGGFDLGGEEEFENEEFGNEEGGLGGEENTETEEAPENPFEESVKKKDNLLLEHEYLTKFNEKSLKYQKKYFDRLLEHEIKEKRKYKETTKITDKNIKFNENITDMINLIDKKLGE